VSALGKFVRAPARRRLLFLKAAVVVAGYRVALTSLPFRWVRSLGAKAARREFRGRRAKATREDVTWAVAAASRRIPRATCLTQALALQTLLAQEGYQSNLHIGVAKTPDGQLEAHAWLESGGRIVIGGGEVERFTPLAALGSPE
jgi:hypothetical protein